MTNRALLDLRMEHDTLTFKYTHLEAKYLAALDDAMRYAQDAERTKLLLKKLEAEHEQLLNEADRLANYFAVTEAEKKLKRSLEKSARTSHRDDGVWLRLDGEEPVRVQGRKLYFKRRRTEAELLKDQFSSWKN
jgi:hypothetical protein